MFYFNPIQSRTHALITIMIIVSLVGFSYPFFIDLYGFSHLGIDEGDFPRFILQLALYQFIHADLLHLFLNATCLYSIGPDFESRVGRKGFDSLFFWSTLFVALALWFFSPEYITFGMSGFCMAILGYRWIDLYTTRHPLAMNEGIWIIILILLGLSKDISLVGHLSGAVFGIFWWLQKRGFRVKL